MLAVLMSAQCATAWAGDLPMAEPATPCAVLMGGGGMVFPDEQVNQLWFRINSTLSGHVADDLQQKGYRVERMIVDIRNGDQRLAMLGQEVTRTHCSKIVQITHALEDMPKGAGGGRSFVFTVSILGIGDTSTLTGGFKKEYRYPLTPEVMHSLSLSQVATQMADDIAATHEIDKAAGG
ncbi:hypothetical protein EZM97_32600 [Dyella soli]|uniref:DUF4410 domain-containing protein n=1 Tax=Dyella soli TaxID=522319 RepID=A0A4R0YMF7_9GAMM|nr:hypothetical protein [Dyella soli]TCI07330.1 hypothetical protein EZM97_32600 [Dyella soli]